MQRPPSSSNRPTTSKGRPKTAGLNNTRPSTRRMWRNDESGGGGKGSNYSETNGNIRTSLSRSQRIESRSGIMDGPPKTGSKIIGGRPLTGARLPTGSVQNRPMTKQGLSSVIPQSRLGTGMRSRLVYDKSYYKSLLSSKLNMIENELENLKIELEKGEIDRQQVLIYEQKAEDQANEIRQLQAKLHEYNIIIDKINTNSELDEISIDLNEVQEANEKLAEELDKIYKEHREKEMEIKSIEDKINMRKDEYKQQLAALDPNLREKHQYLIKEVELQKDNIKEANLLINTLDKRRENIDEALINAPMKQQALALNERIIELKNKKKKLVDEVNTNESPEDLRDRLLQQVTKNNEEIAIMEKQIEEVTEDINEIHEEIQEFENNFEALAGDKSEKYREMKLMEKQIDEFFESYVEELSNNSKIIDEREKEIVELLEIMSQNMEEDITSEVKMSNDNIENPETLADIHLNLQETLLQAADKVWELEQQLETSDKEYNEIKLESGINDENDDENNDITLFQNKINAAKESLYEKEQTLENLVIENKNLLRQLQASPIFTKIQQLEEGNISKTKEIENLKEKVEKLKLSKDYETIKNECLEKCKILNSRLIGVSK
uniref:Intraflagellar transport protein 74 homolog n=1 Tax=Parastrongyloides trichosuri TaxID=131310 RepID=A0A0N4ZFX8_PARTI